MLFPFVRSVCGVPQYVDEEQLRKLGEDLFLCDWLPTFHTQPTAALQSYSNSEEEKIGSPSF